MNRSSKLLTVINLFLESSDFLHKQLSIEAIKNYMRAGKFSGAKKSILNYSGDGYQNINTHLRDNKSSGFLQKQLNKLHVINIKQVTKNPTEHSFIVYRASKHLNNEGLKHGDIIHDKGFTSTSIDPHEVDREFTGTKFRIHITPGTRGHYIGDNSLNPREKEFLLHPGTKFQVGNFYKHKNGNVYRDLHIHSQED